MKADFSKLYVLVLVGVWGVKFISVYVCVDSAAETCL